MGLFSSIVGSKDEESVDPVVEAITRNIMKRSGKLPETYLARLMTGSFEDPVPAEEGQREDWVRSHVSRALDKNRGQEVADAFAKKAPGIGAAIEDVVRDGAVTWFAKASNGTLMGRDLPSMIDTVRTYTANRVVDFMKPGKRLAMRISREASTLKKAKDETILDRLADTPQSRLDPLPASGSERTDWIRERLLAEYVAARGGVMSSAAIVAASGRARGPVPNHDLSDMPLVDEPQRERVRGMVRQGIAHESGMSDPVLKSRHADIPGIDAMHIPREGKARNQAVGHIVMAEIVRSEMREQGMILPPKKENQIPRAAQTAVRYVQGSRGLGRPEREIVHSRPAPPPPRIEKAAVPMGGDRVSAARRYADMARKATGSHEF